MTAQQAALNFVKHKEWLVYYRLSKSDNLQFVNIFSANKVAIYVL